MAPPIVLVVHHHHPAFLPSGRTHRNIAYNDGSKIIIKNNVKDRKSFTPEPHVLASYALNFRRQIAIPRTQNDYQMPHILGDQMALQVLKNITYRINTYVNWKRYFSSMQQCHWPTCFSLKISLDHCNKTRKFSSPYPTLPIQCQIHQPINYEQRCRIPPSLVALACQMPQVCQVKVLIYLHLIDTLRNSNFVCREGQNGWCWKSF